ncbi:MAG: ATP-grasp domain-containing protein [Solirubrobacterales bacterium]|nr:ATP-grasp domain-containing protein [Solirubrobacterales bacterium]MBV9425669.1 ATP-grasp domain-containing protein [Solirubrobacterales bacterium]
MRILVVAVSARMLAQLAVADGHEVIALDRFGDVDLRAVARVATARSNEALAALGADVDADAVLYGAGFENRPDLVAKLARGRELLGTPPELLAEVRDPWAVGAAARSAGARAPEIRSVDELLAASGGRRSVADSETWLRKPRRGGGGRGVRPWAGGALRATEIVQRRIPGLACSAVAIGDGRRAVVLGITEQLLRRPGFRWTGNVAPPRLPERERAELEDQLRAVCAEVATRFGVRGAFGVDAVWDGRDAWVVEVNPRPPAALELFEAGSFEAHVRGARGIGVPTAGAPPAGSGARVKLVLFANRDVRAPDPDWWPAHLVRDIPRAGEMIKRGAPLCTLISATTTVPELAARGTHLLSALPEAVLVRD